MERGCPAKSAKPLHCNGAPVSKAAPYELRALARAPLRSEVRETSGFWGVWGGGLILVPREMVLRSPCFSCGAGGGEPQ
jgi:hypothetical protein